MREFNKNDFPPFLCGHDVNEGVVVAVESTLEELSEKGIRLRAEQPEAFLPPAFLRRYGLRRIFAIIDFRARAIPGGAEFYIEVEGEEEAEAIRLALETVTTQETTREELEEDWHTEPDLPGFRGFQIR